MEEFEKYISVDPNIRFGKPCIKNTRIAVLDILNWLSSGMSFEEILEGFPELTIEQIKAAFAFKTRRVNKLKGTIKVPANFDYKTELTKAIIKKHMI